jgi:hypothetical protein
MKHKKIHRNAKQKRLRECEEEEFKGTRIEIEIGVGKKESKYVDVR